MKVFKGTGNFYSDLNENSRRKSQKGPNKFLEYESRVDLHDDDIRRRYVRRFRENGRWSTCNQSTQEDKALWNDCFEDKETETETISFRRGYLKNIQITSSRIRRINLKSVHQQLLKNTVENVLVFV